MRLVDGECGPAAEVGEGAVGVERDGLDALVADQVLDQLDLVVLALAAEALDRLVDGTSSRTNGSSASMCSRILLLDAREVVLGDRRRPRGTRSRSRSRPRSAGRSRSSRPDRAPSPPWRARARRRGGSARARRGRCAGGDDLAALAVVQRQREVVQAVADHAHAERGLGQPGTDRGSGVGAGRAVGELEAEPSGRRTCTSRC